MAIARHLDLPHGKYHSQQRLGLGQDLALTQLNWRKKYENHLHNL
jgi:hypothetical protein